MGIENWCRNDCGMCSKEKRNLCGVISMSNMDYDVWDNTIDACVTVSLPDVLLSNADYYDKFICEICRFVKPISINDEKNTIIADWYGFIERNYDKFKDFTKIYWNMDFKEKDEFIYQWIKELHFYFGGYVPDDFYKTLYEFALTLD